MSTERVRVGFLFVHVKYLLTYWISPWFARHYSRYLLILVATQTCSIHFTQNNVWRITLRLLLNSLSKFCKQMHESTVTIRKFTFLIALIDSAKFLHLPNSPLPKFIGKSLSYYISVLVFLELFDMICVNCDLLCRSCDLIRIECKTSNYISCTLQSWFNCSVSAFKRSIVF
jgi:hypothetical protein